ncbi:MAG: CoA transferase [Alphaproteobacteria bacterium]|nr:CoA transferase [Alphaproteobacteria bacterium]
MAGALEGVLVVSLDQAVAAPFTTSRLADAGARVIKVERPGGDFARGYDDVVRGLSSHFVWLNRGKESIELDLKEPNDAALLTRMIAGADVFVQNLAPGAASRAGFDSDALRARHPRLVTCDISGYGEDGPYRDMKAYDLLIQSESGLASITGRAEGPGRVGVSVVDISAGMYALVGILEALYERATTGRGKGIKVSLFDSIADWMSVPFLFQDQAGITPQRIGLNHPSIAPYGVFRTRDERDVVISIQNEREWESFCATVLERPAMAAEPRFGGNVARTENREALEAIIREVIGDIDHATLIDRLRRGRIAFGNLNSMEDFCRHPQLRRSPVATPAGIVDAVGDPIRDGDGDRLFGPVPGLNEHGAALRAEFGDRGEG